MDIIECSCGRMLGDKIPFYDAMIALIKEDFIKKNNINTSPQYMIFDNKFNLQFSKVLDELALNLTCCRKSMLTKDRRSNFYGDETIRAKS